MTLLTFALSVLAAIFSSPAENTSTTQPSVVTVTPWNLSNQCDTYKLVFQKHKVYPYHRKVKHKWTKQDKKRARNLARLVAREMGADSRLLLLWMDRGSSSNPHTIHILNRDRKADWNAWLSHRWSQKEDDRLVGIMAGTSPQNSKWWNAKGKLARIRVYKNNPYYHKNFEVEEEYPDGGKGLGQHPHFAMKYGPLDMSAVGYTRIWSSKAPPWIMCNDDGLIAYITAIWAMREFQRECTGQVDHHDGAGVIDRRYARGRCMSPSKSFLKRAAARRYQLDPDKRLRLGRKWSRGDTDRMEIWLHMKKRAVEEGIWTARSLGTMSPSSTPSP